MNALSILRESVAAAWGAKVSNVVTVVIVAGMVAAVLLTNGRTVGAQQGVIGALDEAGTRSVVVRAQPASGLDARVVGRLATVSSISWLGGFSAAKDARNAAVPDGKLVPYRIGYGIDMDSLGVETRSVAGVAYGSKLALDQLGIPSGVGAIVDDDGIEHPVAGVLEVPQHLAFLEPLLLIPNDPGASWNDDIGVLVAVANEASQVDRLTSLVSSMLDLTDPQAASIETSQNLATLRNLIDAELGGAGRALVAVIFAVTAVLVAAILYALVMMRRKDYGRRRALGASQTLVAALVLGQVAVPAVFGAGVGAIVSALALIASGDPLPPSSYFAAVVTVASAIAVAAALVPALAAARRDPARELRVA